MVVSGSNVTLKQVLATLASLAIICGAIGAALATVADLGGERQGVLDAMQQTKDSLQSQARTDKEILVRVRQLEADRERLARIEQMQESQDRMLRMLLRKQGIEVDR